MELLGCMPAVGMSMMKRGSSLPSVPADPPWARSGSAASTSSTAAAVRRAALLLEGIIVFAENFAHVLGQFRLLYLAAPGGGGFAGFGRLGRRRGGRGCCGREFPHD